MDAFGSRSTTSRRRAPLAALYFFFGAQVAASIALGAGYRTANFTVDAPNARLAREIGDAAEAWRSSLAMEWLGQELPDWAEACPIKARVAPGLGAGGATSFVFDQGQVFGWRMNIQGSRDRILDSVLPHEVTHTIFASHFRQPLPRWADEGACTTVEHESEIAKQEHMLIEFLHTRRGIPFSDMFAMREYPHDVMPLYAQGHALAEMLIAQQGKRAFLEYLADGMRDQNWPRATRERYGYPNLLALQNSWLQWVKDGRPDLTPAGKSDGALARGPDLTPTDSALAQAGRSPKPLSADSGGSLTAIGSPQSLVYRGQDPGPREPHPEAFAGPQAAAAAPSAHATPTAAASPYERRSSAFQPLPKRDGSEGVAVVTTPWQAVRSRPQGLGGAAFNALRDTGTVRR